MVKTTRRKLTVRLMFDPPANSFHVTNLEKLAQESEWRLNVQADPGDMP